MINVKRPQKGQRTLQSIFDSVNSIIDYLPTLTVRGDNYSTYVEHASNGTVVHAKQSTSPDQAGGGKQYYAGSGITLSGNTFNNAITSGQFIEITSSYQINCTLTGGNGIEITPNGVINCTVEPGGGGGGTYYADGYTLSTTSESGNTFYVYDVYPLITGGGGVTVSRYGDSPLYPGYALGTIISCPYYVGSGGIGILDDTTAGTYIKYIAITGTAEFDYNAGTGISIDPSTRTINCTVEPGGGGGITNYVDNLTLSSYTSTETNDTFYLYDVLPLLTGGGGTTVTRYGDAPLYPGYALGTIIASPVYLPSTGIAIVDDSTAGTYNKFIAITGDFDYTGDGGVKVDASTRVISLSTTIPRKTSDLTNDSGYITISDLPPGTSYTADGVTLSTTNATCTQFCLYDVLPLLTGGGGITVAAYGDAPGYPNYAKGTIISCPVYLPSTGIAILDDQTEGTYNKYIAITGDIVTSTWVADNFISGGSTGDHMYYNSQEKLLKCMLTGGTNIEIDDNGNYGYINCTLTGLDQLANTPGYITSPGPTPTAYYADDDTLSTTSNGTNFYVRNVSSLLTGAGGTTVYYYGTGLNNTIVAGISSLNYQGGNGIQILPVEGQGGVETTYASIGLSADFYNALTTILARPLTGNYVLGSLNGELTWLSTCQCDCDQVGG